MTDVTSLDFDDCPSWRATHERLSRLATEFGFTLRRVHVDTIDDAEPWESRGSPSVLVDGHDAFAMPGDSVGLSCRIYDTPGGPAGAPSPEQLRALFATPFGDGPDRSASSRRWTTARLGER